MKFILKTIAKAMVLPALILATTGLSHATQYTYASAVRWDNGTNATPSGTLHSRYNQNSALGSPNAGTSTDFLSLGLGGKAIFDFGVNFDAAAIVFETTGGRATYPTETARVYVADSSFDALFAGLNSGNGLASITVDPSFFTFVGSITSKSASSALDLSSFGGPFRYVLLQDVTSLTGSGYDGFDVDAVGVSAVPEPGTMMLLGLGLAGMAIYSKRRRNDRG